MGGSSSTTTTTQEPWEPIQDPLKDIYSMSDNLATAGVGPQVFPGDTLAPWSQPTQAGILGAAATAGGNTGLGSTLNNVYGQQISQGGFNDPMAAAASGFNELSNGAGSIDPSRLFGIGDQTMNSPYAAQMNQIAQSGGGNNYMKQYTEDLAQTGPGGSNPYFQEALNHQMEQVGNNVAGYMSSKGRYGSGAMGDAMANQMGGLAFNAMSNQFNQDANRRLQAAQGIQTASQQGIQNVFGANQADLARNQTGLQAEAAGLGVQSDNVNRQFQATSQLGALGQSGQQNLQQFGQIAPTVDDLRYADYDRLLKIGSNIEGFQQQILDDTKNRFDEQNQLPWQYLDMQQQILQPGMVRFGDSTSTSKQPFNPMSLAGIPLMMAGGK